MGSSRDAQTIYALSSGRPPAGIAVIRVSGPRALETAMRLAGTLPADRHAVLRRFRDPETNEKIDRGLLMVAHGPATATGEDLVEFHCHGGRAVVAAMLALLARQDGLREAKAGEFTRRALMHGIIDLTEAEGLADLLAAETELQRKSALRRAEGGTRRAVEALRDELLRLSAAVELAIDYIGEDDADALEIDREAFARHEAAVSSLLAAPAVETLRDGFRVVIAGPPNAGKSSLINAIAGSEKAIVTDIEGTTRDLIEVPISIDGIPFVLTDSAGIRDTVDTVEKIGIQRARDAIESADFTLWLGPQDTMPVGSVLIAAKADLLAHERPGFAVSAKTGEGVRALLDLLKREARRVVPDSDGVALTQRERGQLQYWQQAIEDARNGVSLEIVADHLRRARTSADAIVGRAGVEEVLDALFTRFCVGK